ncbi:Retrovirus-related Pol polyprotein from transposon TNT 1-94 [Melia azedarach]|uniref:Retrovirus-related Pol polyprotein from transposon TNT 1-94 n=1 Tax=Melia azedarach TaxID=155640 RepID=A0ACC1Y5G1_MELAZ|nr:Retrovirus-related Pol polyprotein from transposon TNT 1-94 [Melia azedarach]
MGLTLLAQASLPLKFWWDAFHTSVFLINRLPTPVLHRFSPYKKLHHVQPDYSFLKVFGCACFPFLRDYNKHKFSFHSSKCVFLGYSPIHKGYKCLHASSRIYVARHVIFYESSFPYISFNHSLSSVSVSPPPVSSTIPLISSLIPSISHKNSPPPCSNNLPQIAAATSFPDVLEQQHSSSDTQPHKSDHVVQNVHPMMTRSKNGILKPKVFLHTTDLSTLEPRSVNEALADDRWKTAMTDEYSALLRNNTWDLVPFSSAYKLVGNKWVFCIKYNSDGSISKFKARLVAKGFHQTPGIDFLETFSPVAKAAIVRVLLSIAVMKGWSIRQIDINNAFLNGELTEIVYMHQPKGFINSAFPQHVCKLNKALYGLKQASRAWFDKLKSTILQWGFSNSRADTSLFVKHTSSSFLLVLIYVDDILVTGPNVHVTDNFILHLNSAFALKDLGSFSYNTPMNSSQKLSKYEGSLFAEPSLYRSLIAGLQYITLTRPDIAFAVNKLSQFLASPTLSHWQACKHFLRYLQATSDLGLQFVSSNRHKLTAFCDANWGCDLDDRNTESEYRALASTATELAWLQSLLLELHLPIISPPIVWCDNLSAASLAQNHVFHSRTKHIELDVHYVRDQVLAKALEVRYVSSSEQVVDGLTKPLLFFSFVYFRDKLHVLPRPMSLRGDDRIYKVAELDQMNELEANSTELVKNK